MHEAIFSDHHRLSLFDPYFLAREHIFFPRSTVDVPVFVGLNNRYGQSTNHQSGQQLDTIFAPEYMSRSPDRGSYNVSETYDRSYEESGDNHEAISPVSRTIPQRSTSPHTMFTPISAPESGARESSHYSVGYDSISSPPPPNSGDFILPQEPNWFSRDAAQANSYLPGDPNISTYPHEMGRHSPEGLPSRQLEDIQPPFSEAYRGLDSSIVMEAEAPVSKGGNEKSSYAGEDSSYSSSDRRLDHSQETTTADISTLDPRLHPILPRNILRNTKAKLKLVRRNSRKETAERVQQRFRLNQQIGLEAVEDTGGNIPGCHVLTPTVIDVSQSGEAPGSGSGVVGPLLDPRKVAKEKPKRKPMPEEEKAAVKQNRKHGVCYRCKIYKEKVTNLGDGEASGF